VRLALLAQLVRPALKGHKASKDPWVLRAQLGSRGRQALRDRPDQSDPKVRKGKPVAKAQLAIRGRQALRGRPDQSDPKVRKGKPVAKAQSDPPVNADRQDR
jgi:hypothetical protein